MNNDKENLPHVSLSHAEDENLSRVEMRIEQEKLRLERERILLEQERLQTLRQRVEMENTLNLNQDGRRVVTLSTSILISIICLLFGGILGVWTTTLHRDQRGAQRLQEVMQSLNAVAEAASTAEDAGDGNATNETDLIQTPHSWLKVSKPKGAHSGISLVVIQ
jgi:hypothetical protein